MKTLTLILVFLAALAGCKSSPRATATPVFHVTAVNDCADISASGTMGGVEYALTRPSDIPLGGACYGLLSPADVGKDYPVTYDAQLGIIVVTMPDGYRARYAVSAAHEVTK